jgi:hypothetical protein
LDCGDNFFANCSNSLLFNMENHEDFMFALPSSIQFPKYP